MTHGQQQDFIQKNNSNDAMEGIRGSSFCKRLFTKHKIPSSSSWFPIVITVTAYSYEYKHAYKRRFLYTWIFSIRNLTKIQAGFVNLSEIRIRCQILSVTLVIVS